MTVKIRQLAEVAKYSDTSIDASKITSDNYISCENLLANRRGKRPAKYAPKTGKVKSYKQHDAVISNMQPHLKKIWYATSEGGLSSSANAIRIKEEEKDKIHPRYLYHILASDDFTNHANASVRGSTIPRISRTHLMRYSFPIPTFAKQIEIVNILDEFDNLFLSLASQ